VVESPRHLVTCAADADTAGSRTRLR
jgi:hypothetical protein